MWIDLDLSQCCKFYNAFNVILYEVDSFEGSVTTILFSDKYLPLLSVSGLSTYSFRRGGLKTVW
jgi:hypothetical protein